MITILSFLSKFRLTTNFSFYCSLRTLKNDVYIYIHTLHTSHITCVWSVIIKKVEYYI